MSETDLSTQQLTEIFHEYSPKDIVLATRSTEAFANEVYDVTDSQGERYFLKVLKEQLPEVIGVEAQMQQRLLTAGLRTPEYFEITPGRYVGERGDIRFLLSKYIPGESPKNVTPDLVESFGATLAKVHDALEGIHIPSNRMQWLKRERVLGDLAGYDGPVKQDLVTLIQGGGAIFDRGFSKCVTHGDLWVSNVFAKGDAITTVFDLETAEYAVRLVDLARTYTSLKFNSDYSVNEIIEGLITGYDSVATVPLTADEIDNFNEAIAYVAGACATWHAIHGTRYRDPYIAFGKEALGLDS